MIRIIIFLLIRYNDRIMSWLKKRVSTDSKEHSFITDNENKATKMQANFVLNHEGSVSASVYYHADQCENVKSFVSYMRKCVADYNAIVYENTLNHLKIISADMDAKWTSHKESLRCNIEDCTTCIRN
jgi:hypothetical protein